VPFCRCAHEWVGRRLVDSDKEGHICVHCGRVILVDVEANDLVCDGSGQYLECWWPTCVLPKRDLRKRSRDAFLRFRWWLRADLGD
jgi:hypothetical protein